MSCTIEQIIAVIVDAVIDGPVPAGDDGVKTLVDELAMLLAGVDLYSPSRQSDDEMCGAPAALAMLRLFFLLFFACA